MITGYGRREWGTATVVALALGGTLVALGLWPLAVAVGVALVAVLAFFRDPPRRVPAATPADGVISPADGRVLAVERVAHHDAVGGPATVVRIFLSVLDVHVNRSPVAGRVGSVTYTPGRFHDARSAECATENESNLMTLERDGERIGVRQIAGKVARRIVCAVGPGDRLERGQRYGMIKFGSSAEVILPRPADVTVHVAPGDRVAGGRTLLATLARLAPLTP